jgi:hypothetical protein
VKNRFQSLPLKCNLQRYIADLRVFRNGINIGPPQDSSNQGSPFAITVSSAATDPSNSVALGNLMVGLCTLE